MEVVAFLLVADLLASLQFHFNHLLVFVVVFSLHWHLLSLLLALAQVLLDQLFCLRIYCLGEVQVKDLVITTRNLFLLLLFFCLGSWVDSRKLFFYKGLLALGFCCFWLYYLPNFFLFWRETLGSSSFVLFIFFDLPESLKFLRERRFLT